VQELRDAAPIFGPGIEPQDTVQVFLMNEHNVPTGAPLASVSVAELLTFMMLT
jgi:hypothetical protein